MGPLRDATFDKEIAAIFDDTRPLDTHSVAALIEHAIFPDHKGKKILELGCGTGRLLKCLHAKADSETQIFGIDVSAPMLDVARVNLEDALKNEEIVLFECSLFDAEEKLRNFAPDGFDVVVCHWLFHCIAPWQSALLAAMRLVKPGGMLVWFREEGDLYKQLDLQADAKPNAALKVFKTFYEAVARRIEEAIAKSNRDAEQFAPRSRAGTTVDNSESIAKELRNLGWNARVIEMPTPCEWRNSFKLSWLREKVLGARAFTNLRTIPADIYKLALEDLDVEMTRANGMGPNVTFESVFSVALWSAKKPTKAEGFRPGEDGRLRAFTTIAEWARNIGRFGFHYRAPRGTTPPGEHTLDATYLPFLRSLFDSKASAEWSHFWHDDDDNPNQPIWSWVRIWEASQTYSEFLQTSLFRFPNEESVWPHTRLQTYFRHAPLIKSARLQSTRFEAVEVIFSKGHQPSVSKKIFNSRDSKLGIPNVEWLQLTIGASLIESLPEGSFDELDETDWERVTHATINRMRESNDPDSLDGRASSLLRMMSIQTDEHTGIPFFASGDGFSRLYLLLRSVRLFPGNAFYLFPIAGYRGEVGAAMSIGCQVALPPSQVACLEWLAGRLLLIPSVAESVRRNAAKQP